jgi:hypothetical protein
MTGVGSEKPDRSFHANPRPRSEATAQIDLRDIKIEDYDLAELTGLMAASSGTDARRSRSIERMR